MQGFKKLKSKWTVKAVLLQAKPSKIRSLTNTSLCIWCTGTLPAWKLLPWQFLPPSGGMLLFLLGATALQPMAQGLWTCFKILPGGKYTAGLFASQIVYVSAEIWNNLNFFMLRITITAGAVMTRHGDLKGMKHLIYCCWFNFWNRH